MNFGALMVNRITGDSQCYERIGAVCFGSLANPFSSQQNYSREGIGADHFVSELYYFAPSGSAPILKELIKTLRMPEMSVVRPEAVTDNTRLSFSLAVKVECADLDRGDVMRNLFMIRNICESPDGRQKYKALRKMCSPRQALAVLGLCYPRMQLNGEVSNIVQVSSYYSSRMFGPRHTTLADVRRFLRNPQDAKGVRTGTFREHPGVGYNQGYDGSNVVSSFTRESVKSTDGSDWTRSGLFLENRGVVTMSPELSKVLNFKVKQQ